MPVLWTETKPEAVNCDLLIVRSVWDYHLRPQDFMRWIDAVSRRMQVLNPPEMIRWNMDKKYISRIEASGIPGSQNIFLAQGADVEYVEGDASGRIQQAVVKPAISASAYETRTN